MTARKKTASPAPAAPAAPILPFDYPGDVDGPTPVLLINPDATDKDLLATLLQRAYRLERALESWSCVMDGGPVTARELADMLHPAACEVHLLLQEVHRRGRQAQRGEAA